MKIPFTFADIVFREVMTGQWYREWFESPYYDMLYSHRDSSEADGFIDALLDNLKPAANSVMADVPCGNGRHAEHLAKAGFDVYGLDLSERNIKNAKVHETDKLHFYIHDMRQPFHINFFDYVFNLFTSIGYFGNDRTDLRIIKNFYSSLKPKGKLVIDFFNTHQVVQNLVEHETVKHNETTFDITRSYNGTHIEKIIRVNNGVSQSFEESVRGYTQADFERMLQYAGFVLRDTFGDYNLQAFNKETSPRLIIIAEKP